MDNTQLIADLFRAYYNARQNKRNTINQLKFELNFEREIFKLHNEIETRSYKPSREIAFIVNRPIKREIFAADFRDRVVHHLLFGYLEPIIEKYLIYDCYSCRKGKGTSIGIQRAAKFLRSCPENYKKDCYIMQMDISGYFMSINRELLYHKVTGMLETEYQKCALSGKVIQFDIGLVDFLLQRTIFRNPVDNCIIKGSASDWGGLPANKSLFYSSQGCGLPIGNLTSQLFGNIFLNDFDHWMKKKLGFKYYGRYVDDFFVMHHDKTRLLAALPEITAYLKESGQLTLHPNKTKINHYESGFLFLGAYIKPYRIYIANRIKGSFYQSLEKHNKVIRNHEPDDEEKDRFISSMNSYLGIMKCYKTYTIRKQMIRNRLSARWLDLVGIKENYGKFVAL